MARKPTYEELEQGVKDLEKQAAECKRAEEIEEKERKLATLTAVADTEKKKAQELQKANREINKLLKAVETAKEAINIASSDAIIIFANNAMDELFGYDEGELIGKHESILNAESTPEALVEEIMNALEKKGSWEGEINNKRKDGSEFISYATVNALKDEDGKIINIISTQHDITSRKQAEEALKYQIDIERLILGISTDFINLSFNKFDDGINRTLKKVAEFAGAVRSSLFINSENLTIITNTHEWCADANDSQIAQLQGIPFDTFGYYMEKLSRFENIIIRRLDDLPPEAHSEREWSKNYGFRSLLFVPLILEKRLYGTLGIYGKIEEEIDWQEPYITLLKLISDIFVRAMERKHAEEQIKAALKEKEILLQEIHHRVKNNMQIISSLLKLQASGVGDERVTDALMECRGRVQTMAFVHETLYSSDTLADIDFKTYISKVASQIFQTHKTSMDRIKLKVDAGDIKLGIEQATPMGLIANELVTNSLKYAFPENRSGEIVIRIRAVEQDSIEFVFSDNGIGIPEALDWRNTESLGLRLVIILADQLDGTVSLDRGKGTHFTVRFKHEENQ